MKKWAILVFLTLGQFAFSAEVPDFPFILVTGDAEIKIKPDLAKIAFQITEFNKDADKASAQVFQRGKSIVELASKLGITPSQITSSSYNKSTVRKRDDHFNDLDITGYEIRQNFTVEITNITIYSTFVDQLLSASHVESIANDFDVSNRDAIEAELLKAAIKNAQKKATAMMDGLGLKVGSVYAVTQDSNLGAFQAVFGVHEIFSSATPPPDFVPPRTLDFVPDGSNMFIPKTILLRKNISIVYKIKQ